MAATTHLWTPPDQMHSQVIKAWRVFYSRALDVYGITPREYRRLYVAQKGRCWICRRAKGIHPDDPQGRGARRLGIDHNHATGAVRGLLCSGGDKTCNRVIGWLDHEALIRAAEYLERPPASVLAVLSGHEQEADSAGVALDEAELDALAVDWLWL